MAVLVLKIQTDLICSNVRQAVQIAGVGFSIGRDPLVGHVADDFVDFRDAALTLSNTLSACSVSTSRVRSIWRSATAGSF